jgi:hypothetical protein
MSERDAGGIVKDSTEVDCHLAAARLNPPTLSCQVALVVNIGKEASFSQALTESAITLLSSRASAKPRSKS